MSFPDGNCSDVPEVVLFSLMPSVLIFCCGSTKSSASFLRTTFGCLLRNAFWSSGWLLNDMVSVEEGGEEGEPPICFICSSSIVALCSNTFNEVAFLYILHNTMSCSPQIINQYFSNLSTMLLIILIHANKLYRCYLCYKGMSLGSSWMN